MITSPHVHLDVSAFPADFRWGVATAAYQIEGGATEGGRGPSIWDDFAATPGLVNRGDSGAIACDHYHRWEEDLDLMAGLGIRHYRMSVAWSRLQPTGSGALNQQAVDFYRALLSGMRDRGIAPLVTLYHWDLPSPLEAAGGWANRATAEAFADYARQSLAALGDLADDWITLNEPWCSALLGYGYGAHAPGHRDLSLAAAAAHHLNLAHGLAVAAIREVAPHVRVGITNIVTDIVPASASDADAAAAQRLDAISNRLFLDPIYTGAYPQDVLELLEPHGIRDVIRDGDEAICHQPGDFLGVNHYQRVVAWHDEDRPFGVREVPAQPATTSFGWSVIPDSIRSVLERIARDYPPMPIYVTESGASFDDYVDPEGGVDDHERIDYLHGYFTAAAEAIAAGVDLQGYYVWSFLDNFEWAEGYSKRFGLVFVDYGTQVRIPKASAHWYSDVIRSHRGRE